MVYSSENFYKTFELVRKRIPYKICIKAINPEEILLRSNIKDFNSTSAFIEAYEAVTHSCFKIFSDKNGQNSLFCRRKWICNHSVVSGMNGKCPASISVLVKKMNKQNVLKDAFLRRNPPHQAVIKINPNHNHPLMIPVSPHKMLKVNKDVKNCFYEYIKRGYCGARAKLLHEHYLRKTNFYAFGDESMNPTLPAIFAIYNDWLKITGNMQVDTVSNYGTVGSLQTPNVQGDGKNLVPQSSSQKLEEFMNIEDIKSKIKKEPEDDYIANEIFEDIKPILNIKQEIIEEDEEDAGLPVISSYGSLATVPPPASPRKPVAATKAKQRPTKQTMQNVAAVVKVLQPSPSQVVVYDQSSNTVKVVKCLSVSTDSYSANQYKSHLPYTFLPSRISL